MPAARSKSLPPKTSLLAHADNLLGDQVGAVVVEYAVLFSIFSVALIAGLEFVAGAGFTALNYLGSELQNYGLRNGQ